jgi:3'-phosphoadenosine 5'-phosphosulfate sulfotransferase (PAPS reductase)/FAD synthetase
MEMGEPNPYRIEGPALISFSGGRTSGYMLWHILDAFDGKLPDDVHVCFANTGKEREETLHFVHECETRWQTRVHWLQYRPGAPSLLEVDFASAARTGEPFEQLIAAKGYLPNAVSRFCTLELKVRVMREFARSLGWGRYRSVVGLRADEMHRVARAIARNSSKKEPFEAVMPMAIAGDGLADVTRFWNEQAKLHGFDLQLKSYEGNCDLCFLKSRAKLSAIIAERPDLAQWWIEKEADEAALRSATEAGARFRRAETYEQLADGVARQGRLFLPIEEHGEHDVECGLLCASEAA